jgi:hypothetical protein
MNFKNLAQFNTQITETIKTQIKSKNNEMVIKMLDNFMDKPDMTEEFLKVKFC